MYQVFVAKMQINDVIPVRYHLKNRQFVQLCCIDQYVLEVTISQACDTTVHKYCKLLLH